MAQGHTYAGKHTKPAVKRCVGIAAVGVLKKSQQNFGAMDKKL